MKNSIQLDDDCVLKNEWRMWTAALSQLSQSPEVIFSPGDVKYKFDQIQSDSEENHLNSFTESLSLPLAILRLSHDTYFNFDFRISETSLWRVEASGGVKVSSDELMCGLHSGNIHSWNLQLSQSGTENHWEFSYEFSSHDRRALSNFVSSTLAIFSHLEHEMKINLKIFFTVLCKVSSDEYSKPLEEIFQLFLFTLTPFEALQKVFSAFLSSSNLREWNRKMWAIVEFFPSHGLQKLVKSDRKVNKRKKWVANVNIKRARIHWAQVRRNDSTE